MIARHMGLRISVVQGQHDSQSIPTSLQLHSICLERKSAYLMTHGNIICMGIIGMAISAICSEGRPASTNFNPVTLSAAANAT